MDFTFRSFYERNANCSSGSRSWDYTYLSQQANQCDMGSYNGGRYDRRHALVERQLEKERIRREILEEEAARRRELEAEVRRELRIEREFELRRRGSDPWRACYVERGLFENRLALPVPERMYDFQDKKIGGYEQHLPCLRTSSEELPFQRALQPIKTQVETSLDVVKVEELPFQQASQPVKIGGKSYSDIVMAEELPFQRASHINKTQVETPLDVVKAEEKKRNTFLAKPDANHPGKKRKDMASPVEGHSEVTKKLTNEWSCALCQISATSELALQDHLKGKKHKSKQAGQKAGMIGLCSKKIINPLNPNQVAERNVETGVENNNIDIVKKKGCGGAVPKMPKKKINFKFYCKMCEVGAFSKEIMNSHKKGKKHLLRLHQIGAKI